MYGLENLLVGMNLVWFLLALLLFLTLWKSFVIVPQSMKFVLEMFGKYSRTLDPGLKFKLPWVEVVAHPVSVLERQLPDLRQDAITKDNVVIQCVIAVFYRVNSPERTVYRIADIDGAVSTTIAGIVRSEIGKLDLDEVQSNRATLNASIKEQLADATDDWGIVVTRAEVLDVNLDEGTREAMMQQINAERARRAAVTRAEGEKRAVELRSDGELYAAQKLAEARRISADADAYATEIVAAAIAKNGAAAIEFDIRKRQVDAMTKLSSGEGTRTVVLPAELAEAFGSVKNLFGGK